MQLTVLAFLLLLLACIGKLAQLQLWQHPKYALAALSTLTSEELVSAPRGRILDCNGRVLAEDVPSFDISVRPSELSPHLREVNIETLRKIRDIRQRPLARYRAAFEGGYETFGKPEYRPEYRRKYEKICAEVGADEEPSPETLRDLRTLHYRAERSAAIDRLAHNEPLVAELAARIVFADEQSRTQTEANRRRLARQRVARGLVASLEHAVKNYRGDPPAAVKNISRASWYRLRLRQHYPLISGAEPFPGLVATTSVRRRYPHGRRASHILGYLTSMKEGHYRRLAVNLDGIKIRDRARDTQELRGRRWFFRPNEGERNWLRPRGRMVRGRTLPDQRVGDYGVENFFNQHLRGLHAYRTWRLKLQPGGGIRGGEKEREPLYSSRPRHGGDVKLTIDLGVQRAAEKALAKSGFRGAVVFLDPNTGGIVAMASKPDFDPTAFVRRREGEVERLLQDRSKPLFCRAYQGTYPPGSVFKTILGVAALGEGVIRPSSVFNCTHVMPLGTGSFECLGTHGGVDFYDAVRRSCNIFFYRTGLKLDHRKRDAIAKWGRAFGLGARTGIELPGEASGLMPDRAWKRKRPRRLGGGPWTDGDTCNVSIGQGPVLVTPLQMAVAMATIANGGKLVRPHVLHSLQPGPASRKIESRQFGERGALPLKKGRTALALKHMRKAMVQVVNRLGTGQRAKMKSVLVAGKTGSAENPHGRTHAWFCGFAPADDPTIAFAVVLENAGHGGSVAAPVAKEILKALFLEVDADTAEGRG